MIFPFLRGILPPHLAPATYFFIILNVFVFLATFADSESAQLKMDQIFHEDTFLRTQGSAFSQMILKDPKQFSKLLLDMAESSQRGSRDMTESLGSLALRHPKFMNEAATYVFVGDEIALKNWREKFVELEALQAEHPSYQWGLSSQKHEWVQWISYQFVHGGFLHLFWNMLFLLLFGSFLESVVGSAIVILTYLSAGVLGALSFRYLSGISATPLVGASAAVSGLVGLTVMHMRKQPVNFVYVLLFTRGYFGSIALPAWLVLVIFFIPDLSGYLSSIADLNSVAYAAHIGGTLWGFAMAAFVAVGLLAVDPVLDDSLEDEDEDEDEDAGAGQGRGRNNDGDHNKPAA